MKTNKLASIDKHLRQAEAKGPTTPAWLKPEADKSSWTEDMVANATSWKLDHDLKAEYASFLEALKNVQDWESRGPTPEGESDG